jgi:hypothetical protein
MYCVSEKRVQFFRKKIKIKLKKREILKLRTFFESITMKLPI